MWQAKYSQRESWRRYTDGFEMEEETVSQECKQPLEVGKSKETDVALQIPWS